MLRPLDRELLDRELPLERELPLRELPLRELLLRERDVDDVLERDEDRRELLDRRRVPEVARWSRGISARTRSFTRR